MNYETVIGLEIHAQLRTASKMFCGCSTAFGGAPNTHVCPVCLGLPGALPVTNRAAVDFAIGAGLALGCRINETSIFARKNYFYPDLPKGYQISQYAHPIVGAGEVTFAAASGPLRIGITRAHLEEDAGKLVHEGFADSDRRTYVDFNRSGVPLLEIVTEPDLRAPADAAEFFSHLREILVWVGVNDGNMEEGSLRCDANVSVRPAGQATLGTKVEVKNLNSFRFLQLALEFEVERQIALVSTGGRVVQETRLWNPSSGETVSMRSKEEAHDYRYFPEPDLPALVLDPARIEAVRVAMPLELPDAMRRRFVAAYGLPEYDAAQLTQSRAGADYFEQTVRAGAPAKLASNWMMGELARALKNAGKDVADSPMGPGQLAELIVIVDQGTISGAVAKGVFEKMFATGARAGDIVKTEGLTQISDDGALLTAIEDVLGRNADAVAQFRGGKTTAIGFLVGQVMKATGGKANPKRVNELLVKALSA